MEDPRPVIIENPSILCYDAIQVLYLPLYMGAPALKTITNNNSAVLYKVCMKFGYLGFTVDRHERWALARVLFS